MNRLFQLVFIFTSITCIGQNSEFKEHSNGLIYNDSIMSKLNHIVDSLNLQYKICELNPSYYSKSQATAHYINLEKDRVDEALVDLKNGISFHTFIKKYPNAIRDSSMLVTKRLYTDYDGDQIVEFGGTIFQEAIHIRNQPELFTQKVNESWIIDFYPGSEGMSENVEAFYFTSEFNIEKLPKKYADMIQYSECMIDTSFQLYLDTKKSVREKEDTVQVIETFIDYVNEKTNKPIFRDENQYDTFYENLLKWEVAKYKVLDSLKINDVLFSSLLKAAVIEAIEYGGSHNEFEDYVGRYYSKRTELSLKRGRKVYGSCSRDQSPRDHEKAIARLSAETTNWDSFLRAHLNIMNDRFIRSSDGSYAFNSRKTYIKELEDLNINVVDLLIGIIFRIDSPNKNHYFGSVRRVGRALSESKYSKEIEIKLIEMIKDDHLDDYNRVLMYYLYRNFIYHVNNKKQNGDQLIEITKFLPEHLSSRILFELKNN
ncbi:MAG: hypothetical protein ACPGSD_13105 [Flavobacteriales bacterium]